KNKLVHVNDRLEAIPNVFIVVEAVADHWSRDTEAVIVAGKCDAVIFARQLFACAVQGDLSRHVVFDLGAKRLAEVPPILDEIEKRPVHILIAAGILWRNEIAARGAGLGARPPVILDGGLEARIACAEIAVAECRDVGSRLGAAEGKQRLRRKRK